LRVSQFLPAFRLSAESVYKTVSSEPPYFRVKIMRLVTSDVAVADCVAEQRPRFPLGTAGREIRGLKYIHFLNNGGAGLSHVRRAGRGLRRMRSAGSGQIGTWPHALRIRSNELSNFARNFNFSYRLEPGPLITVAPLDSRRAPAFQ
jgi:hypothetical protein